MATETTANGSTTTASHTLTFTYDATGNPQTVDYDGTLYYYTVNLQGDVVAIVDSTGNVVVSYTYDAWGNILDTSGNEVVASTYDAWGNILDTTGTLAATLGKHNPLRYRGYVYDQETGLYYLQSRYYNPTLGRFINADALVSTGQGLLGNNMFAYCLNNPVLMSDTGGAASRVCFGNDFYHPMVPRRGGGGSTNYNGGQEESLEIPDSGQYEAERMVLNSDNTVVLYNDVPVIQVPFMGDNAFSFYYIFVGEDVKDPEVLLHEYGHALHFRQIGPAKYLAYIALPSMFGFRDGPIGFDDYYSQLWEYIADILGNVNRTDRGLPHQYEVSESGAIVYWFWTIFS